MKKALKIVLVLVVLLVVLVGVGIGVALNSGFQTWAARKAIPQIPGTTVEVERVAAGTSQAEIRGVRLVRDGAVVTVGTITARYSVWDFVSGRTIRADEVVVRDLLADLRNYVPPAATPVANAAPGNPNPTPPNPAPAPRPAARPGPPADFQGLLAAARIPVDFQVGSLSAEGRALLPGGREADLQLSGSQLGTGREGTLTWTAAFRDATPAARIREARGNGTTRIRIAADGQVEAVAVENTFSAQGPDIPSDNLRVTSNAERLATGNETYAVDVALQRGAAAESLVKASANFDAARREMAGEWNVAVRSEQLGALLAGLGLPAVSAQGGGRFNFNPVAGNGAATGELTARASDLRSLAPQLAAIGAVDLRSAFEVRSADGVAELVRLNAEVAADGRPLLRIEGLQPVRFNLAESRLSMANPGAEFARVSMTAVPLALVQPVLPAMAIESGDVSMVLAVEADADGRRARLRTSEPLTVRNLTVKNGTAPLVTGASAAVGLRIDYAPDRVTAEVPEFRVTLSANDELTGRFGAEFAPQSPATTLAFTARFDGRVVDFIKPYTPVPLGRVDLQAEAQGRLEGGAVQIAQLNTRLTREGGTLIFSAEAPQPVRLELAGAAPSGNGTVRVALGELPLSWANAFLPDMTLGGATAGGVLELTANGADVRVATATPLSVRGISVTQGRQAMVQGVDVAVDLEAARRGETIAYTLRRLEAKQGEAILARAELSGEARPGPNAFAVAGKGSVQADLAALGRQPVLSSKLALNRGTAEIGFDGTWNNGAQAKLTLAVRDLVAREGNQPLGQVEANGELAMKPDGSGTVSLPLVVTVADRKSDLAVAGGFAKTAAGVSFNGRLTGNQLIVNDLQALAGILPSAPASSTPAARTPARDTVPFWDGFTGRIETDVKKVQYGEATTVENLRGVIVAEQGRLAIETLEGAMKANPFKFAGAVTFNAAQPKPYALAGTANVTNFDLGELLRAGNPNEKPAIETKLNVAANVAGSGADLGELTKSINGKFDLSGSQGVLRMLARRGGVGQAVTGLSILGGIIGAARENEKLTAASQLVGMFNEIPFDRFSAQVERGTDLSMKIAAVEWISPALRILGSGTVENRPDTPLAKQPMKVDLKLGGKEHFALLFDKIGILGSELDDQGYRQAVRSFTVGGTVGQSDSSSLWSLIFQLAAAGGLLGR